jgi:hypothetical protein
MIAQRISREIPIPRRESEIERLQNSVGVVGVMRTAYRRGSSGRPSHDRGICEG